MERIERLLLEKLELTSSASSPSLTLSRDSTHSTTIDTVRQTTPKARGRISFVSTNKHSIDLYHGVPFLSKEGQMWIRFTGEHARKGSLWQNLFNHADSPTKESRQSKAATLTLPTRAEVNGMLKAFQSSEFMSVFPVIDATLFAETLVKGYIDNDTTAQACINTFVILWSQLGSWEQDPADSATLRDLEHAIQALTPGLLEAKPTLEIIDALVMVVSTRATSVVPLTQEIRPLCISSAAHFRLPTYSYQYPPGFCSWSKPT